MLPAVRRKDRRRRCLWRQAGKWRCPETIHILTCRVMCRVIDLPQIAKSAKSDNNKLTRSINERGSDFMRYLLVVSVAILLAAAGSIRVNSPAEAVGGGYASRCGGGKIFLYATEKRLLTLNNNAREKHGLRPFCVHPALQNAARAHSKDMI